MDDKFDKLRVDYQGALLAVDGVASDPLVQFQAWFDEAVGAEVPIANAMTLSTATSDGLPSSRIVLLKGVDEHGFCFFGNYNSRKGADLKDNPRAALLFWWVPLNRQVRVEGRCERVSAEESDQYFDSRPVASNVSAVASTQSAVVESRSALVAAATVVEARVESGMPLERPAHWGGYRLVPELYEFWQGRPDRLHDRIRYRGDGQRWVLDRLYP